MHLLISPLWQLFGVGWDFVAMIYHGFNELNPGGLLPGLIALALAYYLLMVLFRGVCAIPAFFGYTILLALNFLYHCGRRICGYKVSLLQLGIVCVFGPLWGYLQYTLRPPQPFRWLYKRAKQFATTDFSRLAAPLEAHVQPSAK